MSFGFAVFVTVEYMKMSFSLVSLNEPFFMYYIAVPFGFAVFILNLMMPTLISAITNAMTSAMTSSMT